MKSKTAAASKPVSAFRTYAYIALTLLLTTTLILTHYEYTRSAAKLPRTEATRQDVAICLAGNVRTFRYNFTHQSILRKLVEPLRASHNVDVMFIVRLDDTPRNRTSAIRDDDETLRAMRSFKPTSVMIVSDADELSQIYPRYIPPDTPVASEKIGVPDTCANAKRGTLPFPHSLHRSQQCLREIVRSETKRGRLYDWVYRSRPDVLLMDVVPMPEVLQNDVYYSNQAKPNVTALLGKYWARTRRLVAAGHAGISDQVGMCSRLVAGTVLRAMESVNDCESFDLKFPVHAESLLRLWLLKHNVSSRALPFDHVIVREETGPECFRLYFQRGEGADWRQSVHRCYGLAHRVRRLFPHMSNSSAALEYFLRLGRADSALAST